MLIQRIEAFLRVTQTPPSRFGREAVGDPKFVFSLYAGRVPRKKTVARVIAFIEARERRARAEARRRRGASRSPSANPTK